MIGGEALKRLTLRLRRVFGDGPPEPDDLAQEALARAAASAGNVENIDAYLYRAAVNIGLNQLRRDRIARAYVEAAGAGLAAPLVEEITPESVYAGRERLGRLQAALETLPAKQREIVARVRLRGETYAEIRAATGWSEADISRQLKAALKTLENEIEARG